MQEQIELEIEAREERGKNAARRLRADGRTPGVLYGLEGDPVSFAVNSKEVARILASPSDRNKVINLTGGVTASAMTSDYQVDPITGKLLHVDMRRVDASKPVAVEVDVVTRGIAYGVKTEGGLEDMILRTVRLECLPAAVPAQLELDLTELKVGDSLRAKDIEVEDDVKVLTSPDSVIVRVVGRKAEEEEEEGADEEGEETAEGEAAAAEGESSE